MIASTILPDLPPGARILVIRLRSIGDIVLLTPALRLLRQFRPDLRVSVVIEDRFRELLESNPDVEEILGPAEGWAKALARWQFLRDLRRRQFALCVNLHGGPTSTFFTRWSGARWRVGFEHFRTRGAYDLRVPDARAILNQANVHTAEHQASAFFWLGMPRREVPPARLEIQAAHAALWREERGRRGLAGRDYAVLHPGAVYATKRWSSENFARLGAHLEREGGLVPLYTCGPGESDSLDAIERAMGCRVQRLEHASLGLFAAVLAAARLFVGNDSGPAHMAAALACPSVVIFGSSSSVIWGPWPPGGSGRVVQNFYDCNPCPGDRCYRFERPECILSVGFDQVQASVTAVLEAEGRRPSAVGRGTRRPITIDEKGPGLRRPRA